MKLSSFLMRLQDNGLDGVSLSATEAEKLSNNHLIVLPETKTQTPRQSEGKSPLLDELIGAIRDTGHRHRGPTGTRDCRTVEEGQAV